MVGDLIRAESPDAKGLLAHLSELGLLASVSMPNVESAVAEPERLRALHATGLLDTPTEEVYDRITRAAADALDAPYAAVSLVDADRQFFKSTAGMGDLSGQERQTPLDQSVCQYAVANGAPLIITDARNDPVFKNHAVVRSGALGSYLGIPLIDHEGHAIGTLCVFDTKPRTWGTGHIQVLSDLAELAAERIFGGAA
jgi:GAF domain-containing protein